MREQAGGTPFGLPDSLADAIVAVARHAESFVDPWWIIGSTAVALSGVGDVEVADVDMLTSPRDALALLRATGAEPDTTSDRIAFRSVYGTLPSLGLSIEVMGGLEVWSGGRWVGIAPETRHPVRVRDVTVHIPERAELIAILTQFGRPKDLARAALLR